jgi:glucose/arabinose dehydrogenase
MKKFYFGPLRITAILLFFFSFGVQAQPPAITYSPVISSGLSSPLYITNAGDGSNRLFIVERDGMIKSWNGTSLSVFLDISPSGLNLITAPPQTGEEGLTGLAFYPDYDGVTNRYFFISYSIHYGSADPNIVVERYETSVGDPNTVDLSSRKVVLTIPHPTYYNHFGGTINFGPDKKLYLATGDGGSAYDPNGNAQNPLSQLGKMLRLDVSGFPGPPYYTVPADNPYVGNPAFDPLVFNLGLRNPFRWSFDRANGNLWIGDVGQDTKEEIDFRSAASAGHNNFGWDCWEGNTQLTAGCTPPDYVGPVYEYSHASPRAVTGGYVYRGTEYPNFRGYYVLADNYEPAIIVLWPDGSGGYNSQIQTDASLVSGVAGFGEGEDGTIYATSLGTNTVYKLVATGGTLLPVTLSSFTAKHFDHYNELRWTTATEQGTARFHVEYSVTGRDFTRAGQVMASRKPDGSNYEFIHHYTATGSVFYRLAIEDDDGSIRYSSILKLLPPQDASVKIYPTLIRDGILNLSLSRPAAKLRLVNSSGALVFEKDLKGISGAAAVHLPQLAKGMYVAELTGAFGVKKEKIVIDY